jgi:hypothetical protein
MLVSISSTPFKNNTARELARQRRIAKKRGFRIVRGWPGWSLIDAKLEPSRPILGFLHVSLAKIGAALQTPLPPPRVRNKPPVSPAAMLRPATNGATNGSLTQVGGMS